MIANFLNIVEGADVIFDGEMFTITHIISTSEIIGRSKATGGKRVLNVEEISPIDGAKPDAAAKQPKRDLSEFTDTEWDEAERRLNVLRPLLNPSALRTSEAVTAVAHQAGIHFTTIYTWLRLYEQSGQLSDLIPRRRGRKGGTKLVADDVEAIISSVIEGTYLTDQKLRAKEVCDAVITKCKAAGVVPPHANTVRNRLNALPKPVVLRRRGRRDKARDVYQALQGTFPGADYPLSIVQIDHSKSDLIVVDEVHRKPIGRPWLTLAIDVYSRMVVGYYLSLEPPNANATGLCLSTGILPKAKLLNRLDVEGEWPVWGFMKVVHCDNAKEFRGKMLARACENYNIDLHLRPVRVPHYGGHIERMMGTVANELSKLPGATFNSPEKRKGYDSDKRAVFTLAEYERYLVDFIVNVYHQRVHRGIGMSPVKRWNVGLLGNETERGSGMPPMPTNIERILIDFMPLEEKTIQRYGIQLDHLRYYDACLDPWINATDDETGKKRKFIVRRDPRDVSSVYFFDPVVKEYLKIPSRELGLPALSLSEYQAARKVLAAEGAQSIDEDMIARTVERLRRRAEDAAGKSKVARKQQDVRSTNRDRAKDVVADTGRSVPANRTTRPPDGATFLDAESLADSLGHKQPRPVAKPMDGLFDEDVQPFEDIRMVPN